MKEIDKKKLELNLMKAQTAKAELEYKILERRQDIERMEEHIKLQDEIIKKSKEKLNG